MIRFSEELTILVGMKPIDMRCSIDGLTVKVIDTFVLSPQSKTLFLFYNKKRDKIKALLWDKIGFILLYKRIEKNHFRFPKSFKESSLQITHQQLYGLLAGFDFVRMADYPALDFSYYF